MKTFTNTSTIHEQISGVENPQPWASTLPLTLQLTNKRHTAFIFTQTLTAQELGRYLPLIARSWEEPRCPSTEEWIQKMWYIYTMEYYSAMKNNEFMKFLSKWMYLEDIILSEVTQPQKKSLDMDSLISGYQPRNLEYPRYNFQNPRKSRRRLSLIHI